ncbi:MAG TPA: DUF3810 family protein [Candidatus Baltobacteraceae bacterium]|nr:DUF3810 family protein [Candidatus Baltobacteraceae bacterium]
MSRGLVIRALVVALGFFVLAWQPSAAWIERAYANGAYPVWERAASTATNAFPWSLGDVAGLVGVAAIIARIVTFARQRGRTLGSGVRALLDLAVIAAVYAIWFEASWGWNYARAPIETRVVFDAARVTPQAADALRARAIAEMNALAAPAHARAALPLDLAALRSSWLPAIAAAGDDWVPAVGPPKPTLANPFMEATGTSGFINPLTLNVQLAGDLLWFERPFDLTHEWSHVAAYAREDEANYLAILSCLRSRNPVVRYSGWLELFLYLPQKPHYARREFSPLVWQDFAAMRRRDALHINVLLAHWSWRTYNAYLKTNRIASGIQNYNEVTRLILGAPLDARGLPLPK